MRKRPYVAPTSMVGMTGTPGHMRAVMASTGSRISRVSGGGGLGGLGRQHARGLEGGKVREFEFGGDGVDGGGDVGVEAEHAVLGDGGGALELLVDHLARVLLGAEAVGDVHHLGTRLG